jgi:hypothetical protein
MEHEIKYKQSEDGRQICEEINFQLNTYITSEAGITLDRAHVCLKSTDPESSAV